MDSDERRAGARAGLVDGLGDEFFAGAGFTVDEHGGAGRCDELNAVEDCDQVGRIADDAAETEFLVEALVQLLDFDLEGLGFEGTLDEDLKAVTGNLNTLRETVSAMLSQVKKLEKRVHREIKDARKRKRRSKVEEGADAPPRKPSIFEIPTKVTDELCKFLGKSNGTLMSRSEVTKAVNNYVKEKGLKNKHDIKPDAALKKLLSIGEGEPLTYFNLQKYLNRHYIKAEKPVVAAA